MPSRPLAPSQPLGLLVVDDDLDTARALRRFLSSRGYGVEIAEDGQVALDFLRATPALPAVILLDWNMPVLDGQGFRAEQLRDARLRSIPVVLVSGNTSVASPLPFDARLGKPVDLEELVNVIERLAVRAATRVA